MRVLITGGSGQVGRALTRLSPPWADVVTLGSAGCEVTDPRSVAAAFARYRPELVIHAAAMTDVDGCERDPERAWLVNRGGTAHVTEAAMSADAKLVYLSTNYVFDGEADEPYPEDATTGPLSVYGASKLAGEAIARGSSQSYVVRTAMIYDEVGHNFVNTMLRLAQEKPALTVVNDQFGNPTYAADLADGLWRLIEQAPPGTYHLTNSGVASWYDWAAETLRQADRTTPVEPIPASAFERAARPPRNGALANTTAAAFGVTLPPWQDGLARCLERRASLV
jgi:dTDP-4-dehydrorhamnose reductase